MDKPPQDLHGIDPVTDGETTAVQPGQIEIWDDGRRELVAEPDFAERIQAGSLGPGVLARTAGMDRFEPAYDIARELKLEQDRRRRAEHPSPPLVDPLLHQCRACARPISSEAHSCPGCGHPAAAARPASWSDGWGLWGSAGACVCLVAAGCLLMGLLEGLLGSTEPGARRLVQAYVWSGMGLGMATPGLLMIVIDRLVWMSRRR